MDKMMKDKKAKKGKKGSKSTKKSSSKTAPSMPMSMEDKAWRARDDLRMLTQAEEIKADSGRMNSVAMEGKKQMHAMTKALQSHMSENPVKKSKTEGMEGM